MVKDGDGDGDDNLQEGSTDRADLDHSRDISFDVCLLVNAIALVIDRVLEIFRVESTANETFIDTTGGAHEAKGTDSKP